MGSKRARGRIPAPEHPRALYTLGHVLHLLEDMGVPAHVRNEPPAREEA
jgi:hypothetical protein